MGKLVRDRIPDIMSAEGMEPQTRVLGEAEYLNSLFDKLLEEARELQGAEPSDRIHEAADVLEVLLALAAALGTTMSDIEAAAERKRTERGGFAGRIWLEHW